MRILRETAERRNAGNVPSLIVNFEKWSCHAGVLRLSPFGKGRRIKARGLVGLLCLNCFGEKPSPSPFPCKGEATTALAPHPICRPNRQLTNTTNDAMWRHEYRNGNVEIRMAKFEGMTNAQMMKNLGAHASSVLRSAFLPIAFGRSRRRQHARAYATFIRASCFIRHSSFACHAVAQRSGCFVI